MFIRLATSNDLEQLKELLNQLTVVGNPISVGLSVYDNIYVGVINEKIVGCCTLLVENKIIHNGGKVGHIEDVTVDSLYRGKGIGKQLIDYCVKVARDQKCYKVILDCDEKNVGFYEKCGFKTHGVCMRIDLSPSDH